MTWYRREEGTYGWHTNWLMDLEYYFPKHADYRHIVTLDVETGYVRVVSQGAYASWSPNGSRIAIAGKVDATGGHLATVARNGSDRRIMVKVDEEGDLELAK